MEITPAILTSDLKLFTSLIKELSFVKSVDIDIIRPPFVNNLTLQFEEIKHLLVYSNQSLGFHLMVSDPKRDLINMFNSGLDQKEVRIYLHQESDLTFLNEFEWPELWSKCLAIKIDTEFKDIDFYNLFDEIQLMSIETGAQGNEFDESVLGRVNQLKALGFTKKLSLDGGINLDTISKLRNVDINRISVGSYFQKSQNLQESYRMLEEAMNK